MENTEKNIFSQPDIDSRILSFFQDGARLLGLPKSLGEIYGSLYISAEPLTMQELIEQLNISKGTASQGLKTLRDLGAVSEIDFDNDRKTYYRANIELKKLAAGFIHTEIIPHLESGTTKLKILKEELANIEDDKLHGFYQERIDRLERWSRNASFLLPIIKKFLG